MDAQKKYRNRAQELNKLVEVLYRQGINDVEELSMTFKEFVKGYVAQLHIEPLTKYELEYIWQKLITSP
jgi:hypothetical protein